ncbi:MAG: dephospho-CoA kinase [Rectinemataceae bacterium]|jgi:dephospho-CoA kinase
MILGLTGGYCAGKNAVAGILEKQGWTCIDVDALGHEAVELARDAIVGRFGPSVLGPDGRVDRKAIARIVFADPAALADQEAIIHPIAIRLLDERIASAEAEAGAAGREPRVCVHAALLYRAPQAKRCDAIIEVRAFLLTRIRRARARDGLGLRRALERVMRQRSFWSLRGASGRSVIFLWNSGGLDALESAVNRALATRLEPTPM